MTVDRRFDDFLSDLRTEIVRCADAEGATQRTTGRETVPARDTRDGARRLEAMSPLAVLGRGYAVAWNADRTRVLRAASDVATGDAVRVTLAKGELECEVRSTKQR